MGTSEPPHRPLPHGIAAQGARIQLGRCGSWLLRRGDGGVALVTMPEVVTAGGLARDHDPAPGVDLFLPVRGVTWWGFLPRQELERDGLVERLLPPRHGPVHQNPRIEGDRSAGIAAFLSGA